MGFGKNCRPLGQILVKCYNHSRGHKSYLIFHKLGLDVSRSSLTMGQVGLEKRSKGQTLRKNGFTLWWPQF